MRTRWPEALGCALQKGFRIRRVGKMQKRKVSARGPSATVLWVVFIVLFMAELLVYSWCRVQYVKTGYEIARARREQQRLIAVRSELKIEEARLRSPERIRRIAEELGLVMPRPDQIVVMP